MALLLERLPEAVSTCQSPPGYSPNKAAPTAAAGVLGANL